MKIYQTLPSPAEIAPFLSAEQDLSFTYAAIGQSAVANLKVPGFDHDHQRVPVGAGPADFERAKEALRAWVHFPAAWTKILPERAPLQPGNTIAMFFRLCGFWWRNSCRIVYVVDEPGRFGFAYGTLPGHLESGEEIFQVELDEEGVVWYELRAFSRPRHSLARLGYPLVRVLQEKFRQDSAAAVRHFVRPAAPAPPVPTPDAWALPLLLFVLAAIWLWPGGFFGHDYGRLPLAFGALLVVPAGLALAARHFEALRRPLGRIWPWLLPGALALVGALGLPPGWQAGFLALPWLGVCSGVALAGLFFLLKNKAKHVAAGVAVGAGLLYLSVGGAWWLAERAGWRPLGFGDDIVRLTALHFHYAGFALPVVAGLAVRNSSGILARLAAWGVVLGVPLTALGITATQLHAGPWLETFAAVFMAVAGLLAGIVWLQLGARRHNGFLLAAGLVLSVSMVLALTYALRVYYPEWALSLDWMRALHGSLNGLVAIPLGLLGVWYLGLPKRL